MLAQIFCFQHINFENRVHWLLNISHSQDHQYYSLPLLMVLLLWLIGVYRALFGILWVAELYGSQ